ncbi:hypothetical protein IW139_006736, partial [Coemansia sp. RSA 353]
RDEHRPRPARAYMVDEAESAASSDSGPTPPDPDSASTGQINERRLRAGMRYTQGGKKTYWLPVEPVDHRAVAFAGGGSGGSRRARLVESAAFVGSSMHPSSRIVHEARRVQRHAQPATEHTQLLMPAGDSLAELSMDVTDADAADDDALYAEARGVEGDFNYPVMEIGVAVGYARRRPYGHTMPRRDSESTVGS